MPITLNGTTGIQNVLGSASAPAESNTTSSNTGLYFPTSTTLGLSTNGTAALTIDASQNVGIGTSSPSYKLDVNGSTNPVAIRLFNSTAASGLLFTQDTSNNSFVNNQGNGYLGFATNNTERMRIDTSGNVGIGKTSPAGRLQISSSAGNIPLYVTSSAASQNVRIRLNSSDTSSSVAYVWSYSDASLNKQASIYLTGTGGLLTQVGQTAGAEPTTGTSAMLIDSSGNVGIGTTSAAGKFDVYSDTNSVARYHFRNGNAGTSAYSAIDLGNNLGSSQVTLALNSSTNTTYGGANSFNIIVGNANITFNTNGSERMRILNDGRVIYNTTQTPYNNGQFGSGYGTSYWTFGSQAGTGTFLVQNGASAVGVYLVGGNTSWTGTSDGRLKNIVGPIENGLTKVLSMNPVKYTWKESEDNKEHLGFIAQEMEQIEPTVVSTESNGNMGITYTEIIPVLVAAIQELKAELDALKGTK